MHQNEQSSHEFHDDRRVRPMAPTGRRHPPPVSGNTRQVWRLDEHEADAIVRRSRRRREDDTAPMWRLDGEQPVVAPPAATEPEPFIAPEPALARPRPIAIPWVMAAPTAHASALSDWEAAAATDRPVGRLLRRLGGLLGLARG